MFEGHEGSPKVAGLCGVGNYLQIRLALGKESPADTVMGVEAAALQEATPDSVMEAATVLETDHWGAGRGGSGQPGGTMTFKVYCCALLATVWSNVAVAGVTVKSTVQFCMGVPQPQRAREARLERARVRHQFVRMGEFYALMAVVG
jgi:hypothetical protein